MDFTNLFFNKKNIDLINKEKIGEGSFGVVYKVKEKVPIYKKDLNNQEEPQEYAAKFINVTQGFDTKQQIIFLYESMILKQLNHRSIIKFRGIILQPYENSSELQPVILTDYCKNRSLRDALEAEKHSLAPADWATKKYIILLGISNALRYLHKKGIAHRDLKPENILLDENYYPYICDFGLSCCFQSNSYNVMANSTTVGTTYYMPPEVLREEQFITSAIDVYSFALIAFEIVTGKSPYDSKVSEDSTKDALEGNHSDFPPDINKPIKKLIEKCWSKMATDRPSFDEIFSVLSHYTSYSNEGTDEAAIKSYLKDIEEDDNNPNEKEPEQSTRVDDNVKIYYPIDEDEKKKCSFSFSWLFIFVLLLSLICENLFFFVFNDKPLFSKEKSTYQDRHLYFGLNLIFGNKDEYDPTKASNLLMESSLKGSCVGSYILGLMYENGNGVPQSFDKAYHYYNTSYMQNNQYGFFRIGTCYLNGYGVEKNYFRSFKIFNQLEQEGNPDAMNILGRLYENNLGNNDGKTIQYFTKSSKSLNSMKSPVKFPVNQNFKKAVEYYKKSAGLGNSEAWYRLGVLYESGKGVKQNYQKALEYYEESANLGNPDAMYNLGDLFENGKGVEVNKTKALEYYSKSAELGNSKAKEKLK